mgnify:CR=1 FL=1
MSCLTTWTQETQEDCIDIGRLIEVITEIDTKLHDLIQRVEALERA